MSRTPRSCTRTGTSRAGSPLQQAGHPRAARLLLHAGQAPRRPRRLRRRPMIDPAAPHRRDRDPQPRRPARCRRSPRSTPRPRRSRCSSSTRATRRTRGSIGRRPSGRGCASCATRGRGLSRARNVALAAVDSRWIAYVDDDCRPEPEWAERLLAIAAERTDVASITGHVEDGGRPAGEHVPVTVSHPTRERDVRRPLDAALGDRVRRLHGRAPRRRPRARRLGRAPRGGHAAVPGGGGHGLQLPLPAQRAARAHLAVAAAGARPVAHARRSCPCCSRATWPDGPASRPSTCARATCGAAHGCGGSGALDALRMTGSAVRRRSALRQRIGAAKLRGLLTGTAKGLMTSW